MARLPQNAKIERHSKEILSGSHHRLKQDRGTNRIADSHQLALGANIVHEVKKGEKFISLGFLKRREGKIVHVWAFKGTGKEKFIGSNKFKMEWPAGSGDIGEFFEIDKGKYFDLNSARKKIHKYQIGFLDRLEDGVVAELNSIRKPAQAKLV